MQTNHNGSDSEITREFHIVLAYDCVAAMARMDADDGQATRRDFVRTAFAALEGWLWEYRQKAQSTIGSIRDLSATESRIFSETTYTISNTGKPKEQSRFSPMAEMFRFTTRMVEEQFGRSLVDFKATGWKQFNQAIKIRHRVTHPKNIEDISLSDSDIATVKGGLLWLFEVTTHVAAKLNFMLAEYVAEARDLLEALKAGDPSTLELYRKTLGSDGE